MEKLIKYVLVILLLLLFIFVSADAYVNAISTDISNTVFRLHVLANSDSEADQRLKYIVRDNVLKYVNSIASDTTNKEEMRKLIEENKSSIIEVAKNTVIENGFDYDVNLNIDNFYFPTKTYGDISLPAGLYDGVCIEIGEAKGKNWWCVMFPPLCFVDVSSGIVPDESKEELERTLSSEEYSLISSDSNEMKFKFKIVELFQNMKTFTAKK